MTDLRHGDCYSIIPTLKDNSIDLVIADPPYDFGSKGGGFFAENKSTHRLYADNLNKLGCCDFTPKPFLDLLKPKMKKFYGYFICNKSLIADYITWAVENKCTYDVLVMCKSNPIPAYNNHYMSDLEYVILIREAGTYFSREKDIELYRKWFMTSCRKGLHPAEKPVELLEKFVRVSSREGDVILDPFMGSGSTAIACLKNNRSFYGIEKNEKYYELARKRIDDFNGVGGLFEETA